MTLPVRDMHEAKRFFVIGLGATVAFERPAHITVIVGGAEIGLSSEAGGWTAADAEYPEGGVVGELLAGAERHDPRN